MIDISIVLIVVLLMCPKLPTPTPTGSIIGIDCIVRGPQQLADSHSMDRYRIDIDIINNIVDI